VSRTRSVASLARVLFGTVTPEIETVSVVSLVVVDMLNLVIDPKHVPFQMAFRVSNVLCFSVPSINRLSDLNPISHKFVDEAFLRSVAVRRRSTDC
jgi:hypothetical protein